MKRKLTAFYAVMMIFLALTVAGCSDNGGGTAYYSPFGPTPVPSPTPTPEPSPTPPEPGETASIKFQFLLEMARTTVPYTVFSFNFEGFNADGDSIYSKDVDKDEVTSEGQMQTVLLTDVPVDVTSIVISYFAEDGELVAQSFIDGLELVAGAEPVEIVVADKAPITESKLSVKFELAALPDGAVQYYVKALDNLDNITGESEKMDVPDAAGSMETYVFDEIALNTNRVEVYWIDETGVEICVSKADVEELETGGDAEVVIKETAVLVTRFSASVINTYTFDAEPASVNAIVYYNSSEGENISTTVSDVDFDNAAGTAEFDVPAQGENIEVLSFVLTSDTDCAFEWFDYDDPQAAAQGEAVAADVAEITPFQGGTGTEADPYLIANPAQLDRVRDDVSETAYYKVVKDMDFHYAGGIDVTKGEDGRAELETIDENARFYATEADYIHGWLPIGVYSVNAAKGEVANCEGVYFNGNFDGGNFTIDGLEIWASKEYGATGVGGDHGLTVGLFGQCVSAHISNVKIGENSAIHADSDQQLRVGAVIGGCMNQNNYLFGKSNGALNSLRTFVTDCSNAGYVQGEGGYLYTSVGGVGGELRDIIISGCSNTGDVVAYTTYKCGAGHMIANVGGVVGYMLNSPFICNHDAPWENKSQDMVSMSGLSNEGTVLLLRDDASQVTADGKMYQGAAGGVSGYCYAVVLDNATNKGDVTITDSGAAGDVAWLYPGGISGMQSAYSNYKPQNISSLVNSGAVTANTPGNADSAVIAGGLFGQIDFVSYLKDSANNGDVTVNSGAGYTEAGGICGDCGSNNNKAATADFTNCVNTGALNITSSMGSCVGGIVGFCYDNARVTLNLHECLNVGDISGSGFEYVGGIIGELDTKPVASILGCLAAGSFSVDVTPGGISGTDAAAELAGYNAFLATGSAASADPGNTANWPNTLAVDSESIMTCSEAATVDGKMLNEYLNTDDASFDWVKSSGAEGVTSGYPVPSWYN